MYKRASLNQKFNGLRQAIFAKHAGATDSIIKNLFGKAPSAATLEAANVATGGLAANETVLDLLRRKALVNMEAGRRRGALAGLSAGLGAGATAGVGGSIAYHKGLANAVEQLGNAEVKGSTIKALLAKGDQSPEVLKAITNSLGNMAYENPISAAALGIGGAALGGYAGKGLGGALGRAQGLARTIKNSPDILSDAARVEVLKRM